MKTSRAAVALLLSLALASCTSGMFPPGSDPPSDLATAQAGMRTQAPGADAPPATPPPDLLASRTAFLSPELGIQFSYPDNWYLRESPSTQPPAVVLSSFDPDNPLHRLEWTPATTVMTFTLKMLVSPPASLEAWLESARQDARAAELSIFADERLEIAGQPAALLTLVSASGGILHLVLMDLGGRYYEIAVEGSFDAVRPVLESIQPFVAAGLKPPDSATPTSGICSDPQGDPVALTLGVGPDLIPLAGRCLAVNPSQRIRLVNQTSDPISLTFAGYSIQLPVGRALLLDRPVGEYLAEGVHFLPMGPELWVRSADSGVRPVPTMPGPFRNYSNPEVGYSLVLSGWNVDEQGLGGPNKEVIFYPRDAEPFVAYLSISLETRTLDQVTAFYAQSVPDAAREETEFNGHRAIRYTYSFGRVEYFVPFENRLILITTDRPTDATVQMMLESLEFTW